jgi:hypothetical protein
MLREHNEKWKNLCQLASVEQDPAKLMDLIREINRLLEEKEQRIKEQRIKAQCSTDSEVSS